MKNIIKYTIGLPILIAITLPILFYGLIIYCVVCVANLMEFLISGEIQTGFEFWFWEDIKDLWKKIT